MDMGGKRMSQRQEVEASAYEKSATHRGALRKDLSLKGPARAETSTERKSIVLLGAGVNVAILERVSLQGATKAELLDSYRG